MMAFLTFDVQLGKWSHLSAYGAKCEKLCWILVVLAKISQHRTYFIAVFDEFHFWTYV